MLLTTFPHSFSVQPAAAAAPATTMGPTSGEVHGHQNSTPKDNCVPHPELVSQNKQPHENYLSFTLESVLTWEHPHRSKKHASACPVLSHFAWLFFFSAGDRIQGLSTLNKCLSHFKRLTFLSGEGLAVFPPFTTFLFTLEGAEASWPLPHLCSDADSNLQWAERGPFPILMPDLRKLLSSLINTSSTSQVSNRFFLSFYKIERENKVGNRVIQRLGG